MTIRFLWFLMGVQVGTVATKLVGWLDVSWFWVFAPAWLPIVALLWVAVFVGGVALHKRLTWKGRS